MSTPSRTAAATGVPAVERWTSILLVRFVSRIVVGELLISMPSTGRPSSSAQMSAPGMLAASSRASCVVVTRRH